MGIELNKAEIQNLVSMFEEMCMGRQMTPEKYFLGIRGELYKQFKELLNN